MGKYKAIHLQAYADGEKLNLLEFNDLINIKGLDYMTQIDGDIIICKYNLEEDKKIEKLNMSRFTRNQKAIARKVNEIIDYINKENK